MKASQSVCIIDSFSHHSFHEMFTAGFVNVCAHLFESVFYYSCKSTRKCIEDILEKGNTERGKIRFNHIFVIESENKYLLILRYFIATLVNVFYLFRVPQNMPIIYCYNNIFSTLLLNMLNRVLNKKVVIICHGELELLNEDWIENLGPLAKIIKRNIVSFFYNNHIRISKKLIFIVLGESILRNLKNILSLNIMNSMYAIDHPFIFDDFKKTYKQRDKLNLGTVGVVSKTKNIDQFLYFAKLFLPEMKSGKIAFSVTGAIYCKRQELLDVHIDIPDKDSALVSRNAFNERIQHLDYILFFYHSKMYKYLASGAVFDAINAEKPVIALKNDYFEYIFSKFGTFGYLADSIDDMADIIRKLLVEKKQETFAFGEIKGRLSPLVISRQLELVLKGNGFL
jgi:hypothetical protein